MAVSVRFFREDPWERIRLVSAAMPNTPLSFIGSGMRFITWVPAGEDVIRLVFRCIVRNGIRRIQIVDPSNDPARLRRVAAIAREENVEEIVLGLTYSVSEVHTHAYYAERAAALADCAELDRLYLKDPGGLLTPDAVRELAPHFLRCRARAPRRAAQPLHDRARALRLHGGAQGRLPRAAHGRGASGTRHLQPGRRDDASQPGGRGLLPPARPGRSGRRSRSTSRRSPRRKGSRSVSRRSSTRRTTTISWPAAWSRRHSGCSTSWAGPSCFRPCWRRSPVSAQRWVTRSSSRRSRSSWRRRRSGTSSTASAGQPFPTRRSATSSATTENRLRPWLPTWPTACSLVRARKSFDISSRSASKEHGPAFGRNDLRRGAAAAADDARGAGRRDARLAVDRRRRTPRPSHGPSSGRDPAARGREAAVGHSTCACRQETRSWSGAVRLDDVNGFVFDIDGTLVHREGETMHVQPGAVEVLERIRASGTAVRPLHERQSHCHRRRLRGTRFVAAGLDVRDERGADAARQRAVPPADAPARGPGARVLNASAHGLARAGRRRRWPREDETDIGAVFVAHVGRGRLRRRSSARRGRCSTAAPLLTGSYAPSYAGSNGPIFSRGAMLTAALAKASGVEPIDRRQALRGRARRHPRSPRPTDERDRRDRGRLHDGRRARAARRGASTILVQSGTSAKRGASSTSPRSSGRTRSSRRRRALDWL